MIKIVCDKCGREVYMKNPDLMGRAKIGYEEYDLCKYCVLDIKRFINQGKADRKTEPQEYVEYDLGNGYHARYEMRKTKPQTDRWSEEEHKAFYTFLWNTINPNEMQDYIEMFEGKSESQTERSE